MNRTLLFIATGIAVLGTSGCVNREAQEQSKRTAEIVTDPVPSVTVQKATIESLNDSLEITGEIVAGEDTSIGAKQSGKILAVLVKDGDSVAAGQLLATLDTSQLLSQLRQSQAQASGAISQLQASGAQLAQARRNAAVGPSKSTAAVRSAEAQVRSAKALLQKAKSGARPQEIAQLQAAVDSAKTALTNQQKELQRVQTLVNQGALAGNRLEQQQTVVASALAQYQNAQQALDLGRMGARTEDLEAAQESINQAYAALQTAQAQKALDPLLTDQVNAAKSSFAAAQAQVQAAQAAVAIIRQQISDMQIRAPFAGKVFGKPLQAGTVVGSGTAILRLIGGGGIYFNGQVPADEIEDIRPGMPVTISIDSLPGRTYVGSIATVSPLGSSIGRLFAVRVQFAGAPPEVRAGMFARGSVQIRTFANATTVPTNAVVTHAGKKVVFYVDDGKAKMVPVTTGLQKDSRIQVTGVPSGVDIIVEGQTRVQDGMKVNLDRSKGTAPASADQGK